MMEASEKINSNFIEIGVIVRDKDGNIKDSEVYKMSLADVLKQMLQDIGGE
jgi:hypothetical protein